MIQVLVQIAKVVIAFFGKVLIWIANAYLWVTAAAEGMDNLITALVLLAVVVFAPGLWLAKHLREKEEKERTAVEQRRAHLISGEQQQAWDASHELTPEEEEALSFLDDPKDRPPD